MVNCIYHFKLLKKKQQTKIRKKKECVGRYRFKLFAPNDVVVVVVVVVVVIIVSGYQAKKEYFEPQQNPSEYVVQTPYGATRPLCHMKVKSRNKLFH